MSEQNFKQPNAADDISQQPAEQADAEASTSPENNALQQLREELGEVKDHALRCAAELENYRKRVAREMSDERRYANVGLLRDLLPVLDNIGRAIEAAEKSHETGSLLEGVKLVGKQMENLLERYHCERIEALGKPFDPSFHQAIAQQPSADVPLNTVMYEALPGYRLHDRVVRASQVIVSSGAPQGSAASPDGEEK